MDFFPSAIFSLDGCGLDDELGWVKGQIISELLFRNDNNRIQKRGASK